MNKKFIIFTLIGILLIVSVSAETFWFGDPPSEGEIILPEENKTIEPIIDILPNDFIEDTGATFIYKSYLGNINFSQKILIDDIEDMGAVIDNIFIKELFEKKYELITNYTTSMKGSKYEIQQSWEILGTPEKINDYSFKFCKENGNTFWDLLFKNPSHEMVCTSVDYSAEMERYNITIQTNDAKQWTVYLRPYDNSLVFKDDILIVDPLIIDYITPSPTTTYWNANAYMVNVSDSDPDTNQTYVAMDWNKSLVLWMRFENQTGLENGTYFMDESTYSNNGTCTSCPTLNNSGKFGKSIDFNLTGNFITLTRKTLPNGLTYMAWVRLNNTDSTESFTGNVANNLIGDTTGSDVADFGVESGVARYYHYNLSWTAVNGNTFVADGNWHFIAVTHNSSGNITLFVDGKQDATGIKSYNSVSSGFNVIGKGYNNLDYFNGSADDIQIYGRVLTSDEINASMNSTQYRYYHNFTSLTDGNTYTYQAHSINVSGAKASSSTYSVIVDATPPIITTAYPHDANGSLTNTLKINATSTDATPSYLINDWNKSLVLWMRFENDTARGENGTFFNDESSWSNNGTCASATCPTLNQTGKFGKGMTFNGSYKIFIGANPTIDNKNFTISAWVNTNINGAGNSIVSNDNGGNALISLRVVSGNALFQLRDTASAGLITLTGEPVNNNNWRYLVGIRNGQNVYLYIDGNLSRNGTTIGDDMQSSNWMIGARNTGDHLFTGSIDDVQIYSRALSSSEINASYNATKYRYDTSFTSQAVQGQNNYTLYAVDSAGWKTNLYQTLTFDTVKPSISIQTPANNSYTNDIRVNVNYTALDLNLQSCWYSNDTYNANVTLTNCGTNITGIRWTEGQHNVTIWANDSADNVNSSRVQFVLDTTTPLINLTYPSEYNNSYLNRNYSYINVSVTETNLANVTYLLYNTSALINYTNRSTTDFMINITNLIDGVYRFNATANDKAGNRNTTETRTITIDTIIPLINFTNLTEPNNTIIAIGQNWIFMNVTITETNLANITYNIFYSNYTIINSTTLSVKEFNMTNLTLDYLYGYNVSIRDLANNFNSTETRWITLNNIPIAGDGGRGAGSGQYNTVLKCNEGYYWNETLLDCIKLENISIIINITKLAVLEQGNKFLQSLEEVKEDLISKLGKDYCYNDWTNIVTDGKIPCFPLWLWLIVPILVLAIGSYYALKRFAKTDSHRIFLLVSTILVSIILTWSLAVWW